MANVPLAIGLGVFGAGVYGTSIVVQHRVVNTAARKGISGISGVIATIKNPIWLVAVCGDVVGFVLNVIALTQGPVVLVQPLVVLMLPVAMVVGYLLGGPRPSLLDLGGCAMVVGGLAGFLTVIGRPTHSSVPGPMRVLIITAMVLGSVAVALALTWRRSPLIRGAVFGGASGACFGTLAVMINAITDRIEKAGLPGLVDSVDGWVPMIGGAVLGVGGMTFAMISFQIGKLPAVLPVNLTCDPLSAVLFGSLVLKEEIPSSPGHIAGYVGFLALVTLGAVRLARGTDKHIDAGGGSVSEADSSAAPAT